MRAEPVRQLFANPLYIFRRHADPQFDVAMGKETATCREVVFVLDDPPFCAHVLQRRLCECQFDSVERLKGSYK